MQTPFISLLLLLAFSYPVNAVEEGQTAPACPAQMQNQAGSLQPAAFAGKVVLIDFWATWCGPCQKSMPFFNQLRNEKLKDGFEIIAINVDEDKQAVSDFLKSHPVDYPIAFDPNGECPRSYEVKAMPSSYLLDKSGKVRHIHLGYRDSDQAELREQIQALLIE